MRACHQALRGSRAAASSSQKPMTCQAEWQFQNGFGKYRIHEEFNRDASRFRDVSRKKHQSECVVAQIYVYGSAKLELLLGIPRREMRRRSDLVAAHAVNLTAL